MPDARMGEDRTEGIPGGPNDYTGTNQNQVASQNINLAGFLGGNPYYNTAAETAVTPNAPNIPNTPGSGTRNFDPGTTTVQTLDLATFLGNGGVARQPQDTVVPSAMLQQSPNVVPSAMLQQSPNVVPSSMLPSWVKPPPPGAMVSQGVTTVTNPETGETVQVPSGGYTYDPDYNKNPYVGLVGVNPPPPTPERQFNNLMNTIGRATRGDVQNTFKSPNPYVQQSGIATALPPRKI